MALDQTISRRSLFSALGLIPALRLLGAQQQQGAQQGAQQPDKPTFSAAVKVVNLFANVRNKAGAIVKDLTKDDFLLDEDGRAQEIRYFSQESDLPLTLGLLVDTSGSQRRLIEEERAASYRFFEQVLRPEKDVAFVIHFDFDVELLQDITSSRRLLEKALENLEAPAQQRQQQRQPTQQPMPFPFPGGGGRRGRGGRTGPSGGGGRSGGGIGLGRMGRVPMNTPNGKKVLDQISRETGGRLFEVSKKQPLAKVYDEIDEDLRHQYSLGYSPDRTDTAGAYHRIRLTTKQKGLIVQTREGYYGA